MKPLYLIPRTKMILNGFIKNLCVQKSQKFFQQKGHRIRAVNSSQSELTSATLQAEEDCPRISDIIDQLAEYHEAAATMTKEEFKNQK